MNKSYRTYEFADAKVSALNKGIGNSPFGPLADSEDDIEKEYEQEKEKHRKAIEDKREAKGHITTFILLTPCSEHKHYYKVLHNKSIKAKIHFK